jgi:hypothetical protein
VWINVKYVKVKIGKVDNDSDKDKDTDSDVDSDHHDGDDDADHKSVDMRNEMDRGDADQIADNDDVDHDDRDRDDDDNSCHADEILVAQDLGLVEMGALSKDFEKTLFARAAKGVELPRGQEIKQVRVVVYKMGNVVIQNSKKLCDLRVPSGSHSGVKFHADPAFTLDAAKPSTVTFTWDPKKDVKMKTPHQDGDADDGLRCKLHPSYDLSDIVAGK